MTELEERTGTASGAPVLKDHLVRIAVAYFGLTAFAIPFDSGEGPRRLFDATWGRVSEWFASAVFGVASGAAGSPAPPLAVVAQHILVLLFAVVIAVTWMRIDARRTVTERAHRLLRVSLRYYVAVITMIYAGFKVIPMQFPQPMLDQITQPLGALTGMSLLWTFMGYAPTYAAFAGFAEWIGAFLLFFRRTTALGALILVAVMANVIVMNYAYGVFVKTLPTNLMLASLVLVAPELARLRDLFLRNRATEPSEFAHASQWAGASTRRQRFRRFTKPLIVTLASAGPIVIAFIGYRATTRLSPLYGVYERHSAQETGDSRAAVPWDRLIFDRIDGFSVRESSGSLRRFRAAIDTTAHTVRYWTRADRSDESRFLYERDPGSGILRIMPQRATDAARTEFRPLDIAEIYPLTRPFSWR